MAEMRHYTGYRWEAQQEQEYTVATPIAWLVQVELRRGRILQREWSRMVPFYISRADG